MTARLGLAAVVGTIAVMILANSKDQVSITGQCKLANCAVKTNINQIMPTKAPKTTQQSNHTADGQMTLNKKYKSVQAIAVQESVDRPVSRKPPKALAKKPPQRLIENPPPSQAEPSPSRRLRRADDPFLDSFN